jgi:hypothetical protein
MNAEFSSRLAPAYRFPQTHHASWIDGEYCQSYALIPYNLNTLLYALIAMDLFSLYKISHLSQKRSMGVRTFTFIEPPSMRPYVMRRHGLG